VGAIVGATTGAVFLISIMVAVRFTRPATTSLSARAEISDSSGDSQMLVVDANQSGGPTLAAGQSSEIYE
jgi:hypothetical protein